MTWAEVLGDRARDPVGDFPKMLTKLLEDPPQREALGGAIAQLVPIRGIPATPALSAKPSLAEKKLWQIQLWIEASLNCLIMTAESTEGLRCQKFQQALAFQRGAWELLSEERKFAVAGPLASSVSSSRFPSASPSLFTPEEQERLKERARKGGKGGRGRGGGGGYSGGQGGQGGRGWRRSRSPWRSQGGGNRGGKGRSRSPGSRSSGSGGK